MSAVLKVVESTAPQRPLVMQASGLVKRYGHVTALDGRPLGDPVCANNYAEVDVVPVTVIEP